MRRILHENHITREHILYSLVIIISIVVLVKGYSATTISTNVQSDGSFVLSSSTSAVEFANNWKFTQTTATTTQISVTDSGGETVLIFDEN